MSPHFGLMDETKMTTKEALLMRAKLHWRCGVRRIRENKISSGLVTSYDALLSAMRWYIFLNLYDEAGVDAEEKIENERFVFCLLRRCGVLDSSFDLQFIEKIIDKALMEEDVGNDGEMIMAEFQEFLTGIGVLPFDESELPPENPSTF
ncbi:MAG: hypothetical protein KQH63_22060 [Desulfobulbaceae bacterium]|nr:hypothetical protein [Desulfobulbaceae bacterium]